MGDLVEEFLHVDHGPVSDDGELARPYDPGRQSVELENLVSDDDGVSGIVAALETDDEIRLLVEIVDDLSFTFVSPLGPDDS